MTSVVRTNTNPYVTHIENVYNGTEKASTELLLDAWMIRMFSWDTGLYLMRLDATIANSLFDEQSLEILDTIANDDVNVEDVLSVTKPEYFFYLATQIKKYYVLAEQKRLHQELGVYQELIEETGQRLKDPKITGRERTELEEDHIHATYVYNELVETRDISSAHTIAVNALKGTDLYIAFLRLMAQRVKHMDLNAAAKSAQQVLVQNAKPEDLENAKALSKKFTSDMRNIYDFAQELVKNLDVAQKLELTYLFDHNDERRLLKIYDVAKNPEDVFSLLTPHTFYHIADQIREVNSAVKKQKQKDKEESDRLKAIQEQGRWLDYEIQKAKLDKLFISLRLDELDFHANEAYILRARDAYLDTWIVRMIGSKR